MDKLNVNVNTAAKEQRVKCPQCGASIESGSKFCAHCGTQIPDDVQKANIRIEDLAELKRLELEEKKMQDEKEQRDRKRRNRKIVSFILILFGVAFGVLSYSVSAPGGFFTAAALIIGGTWLFLKGLLNGK